MAKGKEFELLVAWIQQCLHSSAQVLPNQRLRDHDSKAGRKRQVDVVIKLTDGPTQFVGIVEVRDRKRPIGVKYIEEIVSKRNALLADAAFIVSRSGFWKSAQEKARKHGIRIMSFEEARQGDWSGWLRARTMTAWEKRSQYHRISFFEVASGRLIDVDETLVEEYRKDQGVLLLVDSQGTPSRSIRDVIVSVVGAVGERPWSDITPGSGRMRRKVVSQGFDPSLRLRDKSGALREIGPVVIEADFWIEEHIAPLRLARYRSAQETGSVAEVASAEVELSDGSRRFELLAAGANEQVPAGGTLSFRVTRISPTPEEDGT